MAIEVIKPGLMTTVQDLGRRGYQQYGVIVSGAMDSFSLRMANILAGNEENEGALEITLLGPTLKFLKSAWISITGADLSAKIDGMSVPLWKPLIVKAGSVLTFGKREEGCRAYIAIHGGFSVPIVMDSKSTYIRAGIGGFQGRALEKGDKLPFDTSVGIPYTKEEQSYYTTNWSIDIQPFLSYQNTVRVIAGAQFTQFSDESIQRFTTERYTVSSQSDRMGYRMNGEKLMLQEQVELLSEAVTNGTVQVPPDGQPIILLADSQTTGGYPKIAQVISVDLPLISQKIPGEQLRFKFVTHQEAETVVLERERRIKELKRVINLKQEADGWLKERMVTNE